MALMKFYQGLLPRIIWDKDVGAPLCEFNEHGYLETDDEKVQKVLQEAGYLTEEDIEDIEQHGTSPHGGFQKMVSDELPSGRPVVEDPTAEQPAPTKRMVKAQVEVIRPSGDSSAAETAETESAAEDKPTGTKRVLKRSKSSKAGK